MPRNIMACRQNITLLTLLLFGIDIVFCHLDDVNEFCENVRAMHNQCRRGEIVGNAPSVAARRGKTGPKGEKGDLGTSATIDYEYLERMTQDRIASDTSTLTQACSELRNVVKHNTREIETLKEELSRQKTDCSKLYPDSLEYGNESREVIEIYVSGRKIEVQCDMSTDGGKWTVIQRRVNGSVNFFRNHTEYVKGFGSADEFWIGLENIHIILQSAGDFQLRIDMEDWEGVKKFAQYSLFDIGGALEDYGLHVSGYSGTATDSFSHQNNAKFSTRDHDVDTWGSNCAESYKGGWWYTGCHSCNLNGHYYKGGPHESYADGINWYTWKGYHYSLKFVEMKIRPAN